MATATTHSRASLRWKAELGGVTGRSVDGLTKSWQLSQRRRERYTVCSCPSSFHSFITSHPYTFIPLFLPHFHNIFLNAVLIYQCVFLFVIYFIYSSLDLFWLSHAAPEFPPSCLSFFFPILPVFANTQYACTCQPRLEFVLHMTTSKTDTIDNNQCRQKEPKKKKRSKITVIHEI